MEKTKFDIDWSLVGILVVRATAARQFFYDKQCALKWRNREEKN